LLRAGPLSFLFGRNALFTLPLQRQKIRTEGNEIVPFFIFPMTVDTQVKAVGRMVEEILANDPHYFLVEVRIHPTNNIKVFLDGDNGISIERCVAYNRQLYKMIEESGTFPPDDFSLELSSPGLDEPLKLLRQYKKNIGRKVEVLLKDGIRTDGLLTAVNDSGIEVEETRGKNKKMEIIRHNLSFDSIKSTKIQILF
jgi:ribosome maturation factor RimP